MISYQTLEGICSWWRYCKRICKNFYQVFVQVCKLYDPGSHIYRYKGCMFLVYCNEDFLDMSIYRYCGQKLDLGCHTLHQHSGTHICMSQGWKHVVDHNFSCLDIHSCMCSRWKLLVICRGCDMDIRTCTVCSQIAVFYLGSGIPCLGIRSGKSSHSVPLAVYSLSVWGRHICSWIHQTCDSRCISADRGKHIGMF